MQIAIIPVSLQLDQMFSEVRGHAESSIRNIPQFNCAVFWSAGNYVIVERVPFNVQYRPAMAWNLKKKLDVSQNFFAEFQVFLLLGSHVTPRFHEKKVGHLNWFTHFELRSYNEIQWQNIFWSKIDVIPSSNGLKNVELWTESCLEMNQKHKSKDGKKYSENIEKLILDLFGPKIDWRMHNLTNSVGLDVCHYIIQSSQSRITSCNWPFFGGGQYSSIHHNEPFSTVYYEWWIGLVHHVAKKHHKHPSRWKYIAYNSKKRLYTT